MDVSFSQARRFTGLVQQGSEAGSLSKSHLLITENGHKSSNCLKIITFLQQIYHRFLSKCLKKVNNFSVSSEECIFLKVERVLMSSPFWVKGYTFFFEHFEVCYATEINKVDLVTASLPWINTRKLVIVQ